MRKWFYRYRLETSLNANGTTCPHRRGTQGALKASSVEKMEELEEQKKRSEWNSEYALQCAETKNTKKEGVMMSHLKY